MRETLAKARRVLPHGDVTVLITGETRAGASAMPNLTKIVSRDALFDIGADTVGVVVALDLLGRSDTVIAVDVGTNAEVAPVHRGRLYVCSAPAGPAFEGAQMACGTQARPGAITKGRLYSSVSLYLILAMLWSVVYGLTETLHPGSFLLTVGPRAGPIPRSFIIHMSLVTLTTLGTGDLVPASQLTRMLVAMESVTGVLYVAITIARLVSAYQTPDHSRQ